MKFYGQWEPPVDRVLYENYFKDKPSGFFIESGAYDGIAMSCCLFFEETLGWKGINIEPSKTQFASLIANRPSSININMGLSDTEEVLEFTDTLSSGFGGEGNGSFKHGDEHIQELNGYRVKFESYSVPTISYKKLIKEYSVEKVSLFCLDVEGFEFKVLEGLKDTNVLPEVVCVEYSYIGLKNLIYVMEKLGYCFDFISFNNAYFSREKINKQWFGATNKECIVKDGKINWVSF
jgi:FkbM family methyltransferase